MHVLKIICLCFDICCAKIKQNAKRSTCLFAIAFLQSFLFFILAHWHNWLLKAFHLYPHKSMSYQFTCLFCMICRFLTGFDLWPPWDPQIKGQLYNSFKERWMSCIISSTVQTSALMSTGKCRFGKTLHMEEMYNVFLF